jgi:hypothetical protein
LKQETFTVYENEFVSIKCKDIRNKKKEDQLLWERIDKDDENKKLKITEKKENRFDLEIDPPCLKILSALISDSGYYYCCIEYSTSDGNKTVKSERVHLIIEESRHIL